MKICKIIGILGILLTIIISSASADQYFGNISLQSDSTLDHSKIKALSKHYRSQPFNEEKYAEFSRDLLLLLTRKGYLFASLHLEQIHPDYQSDTLFINPTYRLSKNQLAQIDTLIYKNIDKTSPQLLNRELADIIHKPYNPAMHQTIRQRLRKFQFLSYHDQWEIIKTQQGDIGLLLELNEDQSNSFSGIAGYIPEKSGQKGYFTGQLNIKLNNIGGMGRSVSVFWSKVNQNSQELRLATFSPQIFKSSLFTNLNFEQVLRDTLLVLRNFSIGLGSDMSRFGELSLTADYETTLPTPAGREQLQLSKSKILKTGLQYIFDSRDLGTNPSRGLLLDVGTYLGYHLNGQQTNILTQFRLSTEYNINLHRNIVLNFNGDYQGKFLQGEKLTYNDMLWYGGATTLRGYPEDFFSGAEVGQLGLEVRRITGKFSRIYAFYDQGGIRNVSGKLITPKSFGIGVRLESRMGLLGLDYAFGEDDTFTTAKIHLLLENKF